MLDSFFHLKNFTFVLLLNMCRVFFGNLLLLMYSDLGVQIMDFVCDGHVDCSNLLASITGIFPLFVCFVYNYCQCQITVSACS